jgi:hypothetical protein
MNKYDIEIIYSIIFNQRLDETLDELLGDSLFTETAFNKAWEMTLDDHDDILDEATRACKGE